MPVMWYVKDGPRPSSQPGLGEPTSFEEIKNALRAHIAYFLSEGRLRSMWTSRHRIQ